MVKLPSYVRLGFKGGQRVVGAIVSRMDTELNVTRTREDPYVELPPPEATDLDTMLRVGARIKEANMPFANSVLDVNQFFKHTEEPKNKPENKE